MKFSVLALDFDGTIAQNDVLDPGVRQAISELRSQGIVVVIVTGRILEDLRRAVSDLHFVDAIVAENGAVIEFPDSGYSTTFGAPPPPLLLDELRREGIVFATGRTIVDASAKDAPRILAIVQRLELPLMLAFNRSRVMVLPQAISKATGIHQALTIMRLSPHNAVAIGDAENDHELLKACEVGLAVSWGSEALKASADYVVPGSGPSAVAGYIRQLATGRRVPTPIKTRRRLLLGHTDDGETLALAVRGRNVLVAGDPKSGKSWVTGLLCEQLILYGYCLCIIDPEGDYTSLEALPGVVVFGGADPLPKPRDLLRALRHPDGSVVIDLSHYSHEEKVDYVRTILPSLAALRRMTGMPHRIVVDEAHYFLHGSNVDHLLDLDFNSYTLATYRASELHPSVLSASQAIVVTRESDPAEARALRALCAGCSGPLDEHQWEQLLERLVIGEAVSTTDYRRSRRASATYQAGSTSYAARSALCEVHRYSRSGGARISILARRLPTGPRARTLKEFVAGVEHTPTAALEGHLRRRDFSKWIAGVFGDYPLANSVRALEDEYSAGSGADISARLSEVIRARYEFIDPLSGRS